jgi:hypothetical protein
LQLVKTTQTQKPHTYNHAPSGLGDQDSGVQATENTCHRPSDYTIIGKIQDGILKYPTATSLPPSPPRHFLPIYL